MNTVGIVSSVGVLVAAGLLTWVLLREAYQLGARPIVYAVLVGELGVVIGAVLLYAFTPLSAAVSVALILAIMVGLIRGRPDTLVAWSGGPVSVRELRHAVADFEDVLHAQPPPSDDEIRTAVARVRAATSFTTRVFGERFVEYVELKQFGVQPKRGDERSLERAYLAAEDRINRVWEAERSRNTQHDSSS